MLRRLLLTVAFVCAAWLAPAAAQQSPPAAPMPPPPTLSPLHQAQAEAHLAKLRVLQLEVQLRQQALEAERARIEAAIEASYPGWRMDWQQGVLVPVSTATEGKEPRP